MKRRFLVSSAIALAMASPLASAQAYPERPVRLVVNTAPGGSTDIVARLMGQHMTEKLGQSVIIDNRAGADGLVGIRAVQGAKPDGYTLLVATGTLIVQPLLKKEAGYETLKDFKPIGLMGRAPFLVVVGGDQPDKTFADFVTRARANTGKLSYASAGAGTLSHLPYALMAQQLGLQMLHVPYKGNGVAFNDVGSGRVNSMMTAYSSALPFLKSGRMRPLAVTSTSRLSALPDVPTLAELGVNGYSFYTWYGLLAPAGTPDEVVQKVSEALRVAQGNKEIIERFRAEGTEVTRMTPAEFSTFLKQEHSKLDKLVTDLGLQKE
ncbi:Bug family tripartite tricarboxylate transporter substrate binding protein [Variovorax sp. LjRoot178]|uniref:Bug family tripartite tricarboxylate transporter substrate binding protein n=1 Tax=Variovorax sp. LjRoot178 TaxID=3342277 RepID=UPI003ECC6358